MGGPVDERADGLLPLETLGDVVALKIVAAGKAQESRVHGGELFHQVDAVAVDAIVIGGREKRDELSQRVPGCATVRTRWLADEGSIAPVLTVNEYCFHSVPISETLVLTISLPDHR